jgi:predicted NAD/FAD-binding protein
MSFAASIRGGWLEYGLRTLDATFAQRGNLLRPGFLSLLRDIFRFNAGAEAAVMPGMTIRDLLAALGTGAWFRDYYITPLSGAIWSTPKEGILDFPADAMIRFFRNHALLQTTKQHDWFTLQGGSIQYVSRLQAAMAAAGVDFRLGAAVAGVRRQGGLAFVRVLGGEWEAFDDVILATHADDSLRLLADPTPDERAALSLVAYQPNEAVLHADPAAMPRRRRAWSSWNYVERAGRQPGEKIDLTYWMNSLQPIPQDDPMFVTLNGSAPIRDDLVYDSVTFRHPVYDVASERGRDRVRAMNGTLNTWFCGAWMKNGFHEDGFASAVDVVTAMRDRTAQAVAAE